MSLFSQKNINKAKVLFEKNKDKLVDGVGKATDTIDKKTGGKHTDKLRKVDEAAKKVTGQSVESGDGDVGASATTERETATD